jgi:hypothetical protein
MPPRSRPGVAAISACTWAMTSWADQGEFDTKCCTFCPATPVCLPIFVNVRLCGIRSSPLR